MSTWIVAFNHFPGDSSAPYIEGEKKRSPALPLNIQPGVLWNFQDRRAETERRKRGRPF